MPPTPPTTVRVVVRLKPTADPDGADAAVEVVRPDGEAGATVVITKPGGDGDGVYQFPFDAVLGPDASQAALYAAAAADVVDGALAGYHGTVLAYGQTGSGKTYSMTGPGSGRDPPPPPHLSGIVPRAVDALFAGLEGRGGDWSVAATYVEVYNEGLRDLLAGGGGGKPPTLAAGPDGAVQLLGATRADLAGPDDAMAVLRKGLAARRTAGHGLNARSSRSHAVFTLWLTAPAPPAEEGEGAPAATPSTISARLHLVDLAGSERLGKTGASGDTATEACHINKSLTFLEQVVSALAAGGRSASSGGGGTGRGRRESSSTGGGAQHVPWRSSKLTHLLQGAIGGCARTTLVACAWSDGAQAAETLATCRFAQRMATVSVSARRNGGAPGGLGCVHGALFRLDPVTRAYVDRLAAAAVAKERARLEAAFGRRTPGGPSSSFCDAAAEAAELAALRARVRSLEAALEDVDAGELAELRARVMDLQAAAAAGGTVAEQRGGEADEGDAATAAAIAARLARLEGGGEGEAASPAACGLADLLARLEALESRGVGGGGGGSRGGGFAARSEDDDDDTDGGSDAGLDGPDTDDESWDGGGSESAGAAPHAHDAGRGPAGRGLRRLFWRRAARPPSAGAAASDAAARPPPPPPPRDIVIINTLTHAQLVELLAAPGACGRPVGGGGGGGAADAPKPVAPPPTTTAGRGAAALPPPSPSPSSSSGGDSGFGRAGGGFDDDAAAYKPAFAGLYGSGGGVGDPGAAGWSEGEEAGEGDDGIVV